MRKSALILLVMASAALAGCATPIALNNLKYGQPAVVTSTKEAVVVVVSGASKGGEGTSVIPAGKVYLPVSNGPDPEELKFNSANQQEFGESLRTELVRLGIVKLASGDASLTKDLRIQVYFAQTYHEPTLQQYTLDVVAEMTGGKSPVRRRYRAISDEKDSIWVKMGTNAYEGKVKAVHALMEKLIPDIESYISSM